MSSLLLPARNTQQPQQFAPLDRSNRIAAGALAVLTPTLDINWVTGKQLTRAGSGYALSTLGGSQTLAHRQNNYVETELLPAIGTRSYIAFWVGYPIAVGVASSSSEPAFVLGSSNNTVGICTTTGSNRSVSVGTGGTNNSNYWGCCNNAWPTNIFGSSDGIPTIGQTSGKPVMLMVVRNQASLDFWRDGVLVRSLPVATSSIAAFKLIAGAFVESSNWYVSANMVLCGLTVLPSDATPAELQAFAANPWGGLWSPQPRRVWSGTTAVGNTGSLSSTLAGAVPSASGQVTNVGSLLSTLDAAAFAASGTVGNAPAGTIASSLAGASMAAVGNVTSVGTFASTLAGASMAAGGVMTNRGTMSSALDGATLAASGSVNANASGSFASTLDGATFAAGGYVGTPPAAPDFFIRLPKNPRHSLRH